MAKEKKIDNFQRRAIDAKINSVVSAGAGSGKTTVLSERFLNLLTIHPDWKVENILTLTFTKKATVEMSSRIYKVLKQKAPDKAADFYKANIKTIDSYCNSIAKMGCRFFGVSPDFTQDEDVIINQIKSQALPFILENRDNPTIKALIKTKNYEEFVEDLFVNPMIEYSSIAEPIDFEKCLDKQFAEIVTGWKEACKQVDDKLHDLDVAIQEYSGKTTYKFFEELDRLLKFEPVPEVPEITVDDILKSNTQPLVDYAKAVINIAFLNQSGTGRVDALSFIKEVLKSMQPVAGSLVPFINYIYGYNMVKELIPLLKEFQDKVNKIKRTSGVLTFRDISSMALCVLRDHPEIRAIEKKKYKAIMIDEFQDNNSVQRDMLFLLAENENRNEQGIPDVEELDKEKLFFVGDEKQSIYRFRGGDVSVFNGLARDFKDGNLSMSINYRSNQALIGAFNTIFGGIKYPLGNLDNEKIPSVFYTEEEAAQNPVPDYEAVYHKVMLSEDATKEVEECEDLEKIYTPKVHYAAYDVQQNSQIENGFVGEEEAEAEWVAEKINQLITEEGIEPGKIAILMRNYSLQPLYERSLLNHGIPYDSEKISGFFTDGPVNDIFSYLRLCAYPEEKNSYAKVLRSPFVNLSIPEVEAILNRETEDFIPFDEKDLNFIEEDSKERFLHAKAFYEEVYECSKSYAISNLVSKLWYEGGYHYETMWNNKVVMYAKHYDFIFEMARKADNNSQNIAAFVDSAEIYKDETQKLSDIDVPLEQTQGVHILSIFKSKGLEYDIVFVTCCHKHSVKDSNSGNVYYSKEFGLTINTTDYPEFSRFKGSKNGGNYFYSKVKDLNQMQATAELRRLTYVALTRAKKELYITTSKYDSTKIFASDKTAVIDTIDGILAPIVSFYCDEKNSSASPFEFILISPMKKEISENIKNRRNCETDKLKLLNDIKNRGYYENAEIFEKEIPENKYVTASHLYKEDDEDHFSKQTEGEVPYSEINNIVYMSIPEKDRGTDHEVPRFGYNNFGTIAHAFMEAAINKEDPKISNKDIVGLENNKKNLETIINICEEMKKNFTASDLGKAAAEAEWKRAEFEFRSFVAGKIIKGIIDLVYQNPDGTYSIVDYKTNMTVQPEIYYNQLACYRQAVSKMLGVKDASTIKCYLYYLRFGKTVDITKECEKVNLEEAILQVL